MEPRTRRHWTEKAAPSLLGILAVQKTGVEEAARKRSQTIPRRRLLELAANALDYTVWPFRPSGAADFGPRTTDSTEQLEGKLQALGEEIERRTHGYIAEEHCGLLWPPEGETRPECPVTIEAEQAFLRKLKEIGESYHASRPSRRAAVLRKISHACITQWGIVYGAWQGAVNQWTIETLSWEEAAELFDAFCFAACPKHSPEQIRKLIRRQTAEAKRLLPPFAEEASVVELFQGAAASNFGV